MNRIPHFVVLFIAVFKALYSLKVYCGVERQMYEDTEGV